MASILGQWKTDMLEDISGKLRDVELAIARVSENPGQ